MKRNKKAIVALSGGVDSSVAAALLKSRGFSLTGVFMRFFAEKENRCCSAAAEERARNVCRKLEIPFYVLNLKKEFKEKIVDSFIAKTKQGITPNPCVACNREIKFRALMEKLSAFDAHYVATGHYARLCREITNNKLPACAGRQITKLLRGKDKGKDQSYFLWAIKKEWLSRILFPLGNYKKQEVRAMAQKLNLPTASIDESQEICFTNDISAFLERKIPALPGDIIDRGGNVIGRHKGLFHYTIGQRKGIGLSGGPYYVLQKNKKTNTLIVTKEEKDLLQKELSFTNANFLWELSFPLKVKAKIRYGGELQDAVLEKDKLTFASPQRAVTPGQSAVFYKKEELLGGGIIE